MAQGLKHEGSGMVGKSGREVMRNRALGKDEFRDPVSFGRMGVFHVRIDAELLDNSMRAAHQRIF